MLTKLNDVFINIFNVFIKKLKVDIFKNKVLK